jgi:hypothetical protein
MPFSAMSLVLDSAPPGPVPLAVGAGTPPTPVSNSLPPLPPPRESRLIDPSFQATFPADAVR